MLKKHLQKILLLFITLGITSLQAAHLPPGEGEEGKNNGDNNRIIAPKLALPYYNHTLKHSKKKVDNGVASEDLEDEQDNFRDNHITKIIKDKKGVHFFMMIASNSKSKGFNKFFFFNRAPNTEKKAIKRVTSLYRCQVISRTKPMLSPHLIVQVLGWMKQSCGVYKPKFIHANAPLCITCHAIVRNLFNLEMPTDAKNGCNGAKKLELTKICPLAQQYINSCLTLALAKEILLPQVTYAHRNQLKAIGKHLLHNTLVGHTGSVDSVALTNDNLFIVSGSSDHTIRIWDIKTGKEVNYSPLKGHIDQVWSVAITKDNRYIVSGGGTYKKNDYTIRIWELKTGNELSHSRLNGHTDTVNSIAFTNDNKYIVSGSCDNTIRIWNFETGKELSYSPLQGHTGPVYSVTITRDNNYIVSTSWDRTIRIWNFTTGKELGYSPLKGHTNCVNSLAVTSDNEYIVSGSDDRTIRIWHFKTGKQLSINPLKGHTSPVRSVAITSDNEYIVSGSGDNTIRIWDLKTGKQLAYTPLIGHTGYIMSVAATSDSAYIVSSSNDKTIRIWDLKLLNKLIKEDNRDQNEQKEDNEIFDLD